MSDEPEARPVPRIALVTYSTKPRGGVIHCLELAEALHAMGCPVHVFALGDPAAGFFRPTAVPHTVFPAPQPEGTLEDRVWRSLSALREGLERAASRGFDVLHAQDCIAGRAAVALREAGVSVLTVRTVHHVDDFTTEALVECQRRSILDPDRVLVVSQYWRQRLQDDFGVHAEVVTNGVNLQRCQPPRGFDRAAPRVRIGASDRMLFLTVGGIEPRKGTRELVEAMAMLRSWYHCAGVFVFPSVAEGWGLALLEAMGSGLPAIATDMPVFREFLDPVTPSWCLRPTPPPSAGPC